MIFKQKLIVSQQNLEAEKMNQPLLNRLMTTRVKAFMLIAFAFMAFGASQAIAQCTYGWGYVYVTSPSAYGSYTRNTTMTIRWYGDRYVIGNYSGKYKAEYSDNGGGTWTTIDAAIDGYATSFNWLIPTSVTPGSNFYMRVSEVPGPSFGCSFSYPGTSGPFTIIKGCFPPVITVQPKSSTVCVGSSVVFNVTSDVPDGAGTFEWRKGGVTVATTPTSSYTISPVTLSSAGFYDVVIRDNCNPVTAVTSSGTGTLTVIESPVITTQMPALRIVCQNANDTLRIAATGAGLTYQWFKDGVAITGARGTSYVINNATTASANASYTVVVSGTCAPAVTSSPSVLTVAAKPLVTVEPSNLDICPGTDGSISLTATGANLTYQWFKDGVAVPNGFNSTLNFPKYGYASNGQYYCRIVSNVFNPNNCPVTVQSRAVRVSGFRAPSVTTDVKPADACVGSSVTLLAEFLGNGLTYQWYKDTVLVPNAASNSLTISRITSANAGNYYIRATGTCGLTAQSTVAKVTVIAKPVFTAQPISQRLTVGDKLELMVAASDSRTIKWTKNDKPIAGATKPTYVIDRVSKGDAGYYNAIVSNPCGGASSAYANVTVLDPVTPEPALELSTMSIDFGDITVGYDKSLTLNGFIKNVGTAPLLVSGISTSPNEFTITNAPTLPLTLAPNASAGLTVKASPTTQGSLNGTLTVRSNSPSSPSTSVSLSATYVLRYTHALTENFGNVFTDASLDRCISLTNTSAMSIAIEQGTFTGANAGQYSVVTTLPLVIPAGQSADLCVKFTPGTTGAKNATLNLRSSTGGNSSITLSGNGTPATGVTDAIEAQITASPNPMTDRVEVRFGKATPAMMITVVSSTGRTVASFSNPGVDAGGSFRWNGQDASGASVASGSYTMVIRYGEAAVSLPISIIR